MNESQLELKVFPLNMCTCTCIYPLHLGTCRFVYSHVAGRCRRRVILDHFEDSDRDAGSCGDCCDVCVSSKEDECEAEPEMSIVAETVRNLPGLGEVKVCADLLNQAFIHIT